MHAACVTVKFRGVACAAQHGRAGRRISPSCISPATKLSALTSASRAGDACKSFEMLGDANCGVLQAVSHLAVILEWHCVATQPCRRLGHCTCGQTGRALSHCPYMGILSCRCRYVAKNQTAFTPSAGPRLNQREPKLTTGISTALPIRRAQP
jgi:hypothetical protein